MPINLDQSTEGSEALIKKRELIQALESARDLADALELHLCAALVDQALSQARR